ncbi:uracil-DNA glycosylase [Bacillus sp. CRN 9]|uniref:uracil-DNA glycosylase n=1 Tax=Cytobacillus horneckiae TaxID=549687 RepID=UPI001561CB3B|nr:uracil-DNA glycosylase [Bacillus sp. CRN 9]
MNHGKINCFQCKFFYVTWDKNHPRGCKSFGFKTKKLPSIEVMAASGQPCLRFEKKN